VVGDETAEQTDAIQDQEEVDGVGLADTDDVAVEGTDLAVVSRISIPLF
jgi:hypothetical protein